MTQVFIAVDPDDVARRALERLTRRVALALPSARVVAPETLHVTLAFLGEQDDDGATNAITAAREAAALVTPFALRLGAVGVFGPEQAPRVIWAGLEGEIERLRALAQRLGAALDKRGVWRDASNPFTPHFTLARLKTPLDLHATTELARLRAEPPSANTWNITEMRVMRSETKPTGARYTPLAVIPFHSL